jgi:trimethylamine--corrinoid protein Co-methyltransferase
MPSLAACFGTDAHAPGTWQSAAEPAPDAFLAGLVSPEIVTGMGLSETYTLLHPEQLIMDSDLYHRARYYLTALDVNDETLALDAIRAVGPGGNFLGQKHTRQHMRASLVRGITHELDAHNHYRDPHEVARERVRWILENHHPEPLEDSKQLELTRILSAAEKELGNGK